MWSHCASSVHFQDSVGHDGVTSSITDETTAINKVLTHSTLRTSLVLSALLIC